jgi:hypothetical protein
MDDYGISTLHEYKEILIDSATCTNLNKPEIVLDNPIVKVVGFKLIEAEIPCTYYVIHSPINTFLLTNGVVTNAVITITPGNYSTTSFMVELDKQLNAASATQYATTYSSTTGKFTITSTVAEAFQLILANQKIATVLGFLIGTATASAGGILISTNYVNVTGPDFLLICGSLGSTLSEKIKTENPLIKGNIMAKVQITCNPGNILFYKDTTNEKYFEFGEITIDRLSLFLSFGDIIDPIDLNGAAFSVKIGLICERPNVSPFTSQFVSRTKFS